MDAGEVLGVLGASAEDYSGKAYNDDSVVEELVAMTQLVPNIGGLLRLLPGIVLMAHVVLDNPDTAVDVARALTGRLEEGVDGN